MQRIGLVTTLLASLALCSNGGRAAPPAESKTFKFSGIEWEARQAGLGGPGPNQWDPENVRVDRQGRLHLKVTRVVVPARGESPSQVEWRCAELTSTRRFGFGRYQFQVIGRIDKLDRNVVLGLFDYPTPDVGKDGTNEIDIEFARWGDSAAPNGAYTVCPATGKRSSDATHAFEFSLDGTERPTDTTQRFTRAGDRITFQSLEGLRDDDQHETASWAYAPANNSRIPQEPLPIHINLWLFRGQPPSDGKEIEIVIKKVSFIPD
jgi:hypothetical protein